MNTELKLKKNPKCKIEFVYLMTNMSALIAYCFAFRNAGNFDESE